MLHIFVRGSAMSFLAACCCSPAAAAFLPLTQNIVVDRAGHERPPSVIKEAMTLEPDATSAYAMREMRSTVTMLKYLSRTSSESQLNKVLQQNARCEGTLAEQRRRAGKLRNDREHLEAQLQSRVQQLANTLQADASARATAKEQAAYAARRENRAAEHAARVMGAVAPHRAAARDAALAVVAPRDWQPWSPSSPPLSPPRPSTSPSGTHRRRSHSPPSVGQQQRPLALRPGRYCLRSCVTDTDSLDESTYVVCDGRSVAMGR